MRGLPFILIALFIDGLQALVSLAFIALGATLTAATPLGAAAGCGAAGFAADGAVTAIKSAVVCAIASPFGAPLGVALGFAASYCIGIVLGCGFVVLLWFNGLAKWKYIFAGGMGELIPGLDLLPAWTVMTVLCIIQTNKEEGTLVGGAAAAFGSTLLPTSLYGTGFKGVKSIMRQKVAVAERAKIIVPDMVQEARTTSRQQLKGNLKDIDGIRSPSETRPRTRYAI